MILIKTTKHLIHLYELSWNWYFVIWCIKWRLSQVIRRRQYYDYNGCTMTFQVCRIGAFCSWHRSIVCAYWRILQRTQSSVQCGRMCPGIRTAVQSMCVWLYDSAVVLYLWKSTVEVWVLNVGVIILII